MTEYGGRRSQAERDAITIEIGYALCSALFAAAVVFGAIGGSGYALELPHALRRVLLLIGGGSPSSCSSGGRARAVALSVSGGRGPRQPSQPGRTSPDS